MNPRERQNDVQRLAGTGDTRIDVEELLGELHYIAGSGDHVEYDIRRTACEAEDAIDRLRARVNELQLSRAEIDALQHVVEDGRFADLGDYGRLRSLLVRLRPEWEDEADRPQPVKDAESDRSKPITDDRLAGTGDTPAPHATPPQGSVPSEGSVPDSRTENEPVAWWLKGSEYDTGCEYEYVSLVKESAEAAANEGGTVTPLYAHPQPTLTDEEREALEASIWVVENEAFRDERDAKYAAALRKLLERLS